MDPLITNRQPSMLFPVILILILGELFIPETDASFFMETTEKILNTVTITLYECYSAQETADLATAACRSFWILRRRRRSGTPRFLRSFSRSNDFTCSEISERPKKIETYRNTNFYLVTDLSLQEGKLIVTEESVTSTDRKKREEKKYIDLTSPTSSLSTLAGVVIIDEVGDTPTFLDGSRSAPAQNLRDESETILVANKFLEAQQLREFVQYMGVPSYRKFMHPTLKLLEQLRLFGKVLEQVQDRFNKDVRHGHNIQADTQTEIETRNDVQAAVKLLIKKLIDPCVVFLPPEEKEVHRKSFTINEANGHCENSCTFLAVGFSAHRVGSSECGNALVDGECIASRCYCVNRHTHEKKPAMYIRMIKCSNDLRIGIAAVGTKSLAHSALAALWKGMSRNSGVKDSFLKAAGDLTPRN